MALPFPYILSGSSNIATGSYLNQKETGLFVTGYKQDWSFGSSERDVLEFSVFNLNDDPLGWDVLNTSKSHKTTSLSYLDAKNQTITYSYSELISDFILSSNGQILVSPTEQLSSSFGITQGSYVLTYNFVRQMAGSQVDPLVVKDISPSRKEVKLVPGGNGDTQFQAFCLKKFEIKDVASTLLSLTNQCPYSQIYSAVKGKYANEIAFLKQLLFLETDGAFLAFIKSLYEDIPTSDTSSNTNKRKQGIRTYFQNYLLSNNNTVSDFQSLADAFRSFAVLRVSQQFTNYGNPIGTDFAKAKQFLVEFFSTEFYQQVTAQPQSDFQNKFYSYLRNVLNLGNNTMFSIVDHAYLDERVNDTDPLTLLLKLKEELPDEVKIQSECWVTNTSIAPLVVNVIVRQNSNGKTVKISPPNFRIQTDDVSLYNVNKAYTAPELTPAVDDQQSIDLSKKISELQVDYTDFSNFVVFSSALQRVANFKTKIAKWTNLSSSLVTLNTAATTAAAKGVVYPYYASERDSIQSQMSNIVTSFDGYESYLFTAGSYAFDPIRGNFVNTAFVKAQDAEAAEYDKRNRDSLINNTPDHVVLDEANDDYLTFLNMIGHFFDNIYLYIANLPSEKSVQNDPTQTLSKAMVDHMLQSFGWKLDTTHEDLTTLATHTDSDSSLSAEDRSKAIRTRVLSTLPQIYKTKGTEEAIRLLLACFGIPSELLSIREYGSDDFVTSSLVTYSRQERACLFAVSGSQISFAHYLSPKPNVRTVEFKLVLNNPEIYSPRKYYPLFDAYQTYVSASYGMKDFPAWQIGFSREYGNMGRMYAVLPTAVGNQIAYGKANIFLTSSLLPLFDGGIFNIRLRRNDPDDGFQFTPDTETVQARYDLTVQRNESGRQVFKSINFQYGQSADNCVWDGTANQDSFYVTQQVSSTTQMRFNFGAASSTNNVNLAIGNLMIWDVPISDADFEIHCNDFGSYAYSGSDPEVHLISRMSADEPTNFLDTMACSSTDGVHYQGEADGVIHNASEYYNTNNRAFGASGFDYISYMYFPLNPTITFDSGSCVYTAHPTFPYEFVVRNVENVYTTPNYGPNRFKNQKIKYKQQSLEARLDDKSRSTFDSTNRLQSNSNLVGLYLDPQDTKNREIVRYLGNADISDLIGDPSDLYSDSYSGVKALNVQFNSFGTRKVLFNELITLYKIYFNRSIFETIENVIPARANLRTGIVVEPTVLERPKYQHHPIFSEAGSGSVTSFEVTPGHYTDDPVTKVMRFGGAEGNTSNGQLELLYGEFNIDTTKTTHFDASTLPPNNTAEMDLSFVGEANFNNPVNYPDYYTDLPDQWQQGSMASLGGDFGYPQATGVMWTNPSTTPTFLVKKWERHVVYSKTGSYVKDSNRSHDTYVTNSVWLYSLVEMTPAGYNNLFYTSSVLEPISNRSAMTKIADVQSVGTSLYYTHRANTAKGTPNQTVTAVKGTPVQVNSAYAVASAPFFGISRNVFYEVFKGYPRNHYTHKRMQFSPCRFPALSGNAENQQNSVYVRGRQTKYTTIDPVSGLENGSLPIESIQTSNLNLIKADNVINE